MIRSANAGNAKYDRPAGTPLGCCNAVMMAPMIAYVYFNSSSLSSFNDGWIKASSSYGNLVGQLLFGYLGDVVGRKQIYGVELIIVRICYSPPS